MSAARPSPRRRGSSVGARTAPMGALSRQVRGARAAARLLFVLMPVYVLLVGSFKSAARPIRAAPGRCRRSGRWRRGSEAWDGEQYGLLPVRTASSSAIPATIISTMHRVPERLRAVALALPGRRPRLPVPPVRDVHPLPGGDDPADPDLHRRGLRRTGSRGSIFAHIVYGIPITHADLPQLLRDDPRTSSSRRRAWTERGMLRTYWSVVLPISAPAFVVTAIWQFTSIWNDFLFAVFISPTRRSGR